MTRAELNTYIDTNITDKTEVNSITPVDEGNALKEVADYVDQEVELKQNISDLSIDVVTDGESDIKYPSVKAIKDYVDQEVELKQNISDLSIDVVTDGESDIKYPSVKAIKDYVDQEITAVKPYKVYSILISQTGANDPAVTTLLENTFDGVITWARISTGTYEGTITTTEFTNLKTGFIITPIGVDLNCASYSPTSSTVRIQTWVPSSVAFADGQLNETFYEIRVYS